MQHDTGADEQREIPPNLDIKQIRHGAPIYDTDGEKVGTVSEFNPDRQYLVMQKGWFFPHDVFVPIDAITRQDADGLYLRYHKSDLKDMRWDEVPAVYEMRNTLEPGSLVIPPEYSSDLPNSVDEDITPTPDDDANPNMGGLNALETDAPTQALAPDLPYPGDMQAAPRQLAPEAQQMAPANHMAQMDTNTARDTVSQTPSINADRKDTAPERPANTSPTIRIERAPLNQARDIDPDAFQEKDFDVPIMGEELEVHKRPIVAEEIRLHKDKITETQQVTDTVRREQVHIDGADEIDTSQPQA